MYRLEWEKTKEGTARLLGVAEMPSELTVPDEIEGLPITEVGPYCFAKNKYLERVVLPDTVAKIDRMAFYNCTSLKELEVGSAIEELGSDAFMNCHQLHELKVRCWAQERSGIRLILRQISHDMYVHFLGSQRADKGTIDTENSEEARLLFTEYYETYDEVAPAHLFGRNIEGEGFRARQCFKEGVFEYARYDSTFQKACAEEREATLCEMAMNRLRYPVGLTEEVRKRYAEYVTEHLAHICQTAVLRREPELIEFLCKNQLMEQAVLEQTACFAAECEWAEGGALMLRLKEQYFALTKKNRYEFEDF